jgi:hypothetical protein
VDVVYGVDNTSSKRKPNNYRVELGAWCGDEAIIGLTNVALYCLGLCFASSTKYLQEPFTFSLKEFRKRVIEHVTAVDTRFQHPLAL